MKNKVLLFGMCIGILVLITGCSAVIVAPSYDYYSAGVVWKSDPFDAYNATPLKQGEYYLVDEYIYINPKSGYLHMIYAFMGYDGLVYYTDAPMSDYYMHRIPDVGGKYETDRWGMSNYYSSSYTLIP